MGCITDDHDESKGLAIGDKIPSFIVDACISDTADWRYGKGDNTQLSSQVLTGKVGIIIFFNTDCEDCQRELPEIQKAYDAIKGNSDYELICIAREESKADIEKYWQANGLTLPYSAQSDRSVYNLFASTIIPRIYISNKQGIITYIHTDASVTTSEQLISEMNTAPSIFY